MLLKQGVYSIGPSSSHIDSRSDSLDFGDLSSDTASSQDGRQSLLSPHSFPSGQQNQASSVSSSGVKQFESSNSLSNGNRKNFLDLDLLEVSRNNPEAVLSL